MSVDETGRAAADMTAPASAVPAFKLSHLAYSIIHLARDLALHLGLSINPWNASQMPAFSAEVQRQLGRPRNDELDLRPSAEMPGVTRRLVQQGHVTERPEPVLLNERPQALPGAGRALVIRRDLHLVTIEGGAICDIGCVPIVFGPDGKTMLQECSSNYAGLIHYYDFSFADFLQAQPYIDGIVFALYVDVGPDNYCHWMVDFLPRLALLRQQFGHRDVYLATPPLTSAYHRESLRLCGFDESRIIELKLFGGVRARELVILDDVGAFFHPAHNAAPWALDFLRGTIGLLAVAEAGLSPTPRKLFVSRADAGRRRLANETALMERLSALGYERVVPSALSFSAQIATFAGATHIVGVHGAGLTNLVFSRPAATLIELFPPFIGTPAYYLLCASTNRPYYGYLAHKADDDETSSERLTVDIEDFMSRAGPYL
jgi:hypothetical protein